MVNKLANNSGFSIILEIRLLHSENMDTWNIGTS